MADYMANSVSLSLGTNNRGSYARDDLAVLKPTVTQMPALLLEMARFGSDETILHSSTAARRTAEAIKDTVDAFVVAN